MKDYLELTNQEIDAINHFNSFYSDYELPLEEGFYYDFAISDGNYVSILAIMPLADEAELFGITLPEYTQKGYFSDLLTKNNLKAIYPRIIFLTSSSITCTRPIDSVEYLLKLDPLSISTMPSTDNLQIIDNGQIFKLIDTTVSKTTPIGQMSLEIYDDNSALIYSFEIKENFRRKGYGEKFIRMLASHYKFKALLLHVTGDNTPALSLYQKLGFKTLEKITYYLL